ncbi:MAG: sortase [Firmicutes bacterium]|nr:sortase [Bacillota bacterium]MBR3375173.1 sortase [Bacillota bacterium]
MKGLGRTLRIVLIVVLLALIVFSGYNIFKIIMNYHEIDVVAEEAVEKYVYVDEDDFPKVDFESLQATNSDVVAWLYIPDTNVNFPVVKGPSNYTYLNLNYEGNYSISGSIFMDIACSSDFSDAETLLYGHNMHNGAMFGRLKKFNDGKYLEAHKDVFVLLPTGETMKYSASVGKNISINDDVYTLPKYGDGPETLVLSTCTDDSSDVERFVLICKYEGNI